MLNRKAKNKKALKMIKCRLSNKFQQIEIKSLKNIAEYSDLIIYGIGTIIRAKLDETDTIHIKIESINGCLYEGFTTNYEWFIETFYF